VLQHAAISGRANKKKEAVLPNALSQRIPSRSERCSPNGAVQVSVSRIIASFSEEQTMHKGV
jgi:hypothetical protein